MKVDRGLLAFGVLAVVIVVVVMSRNPGASTTAAPANVDVKAEMARNIADFPSISERVHHDPDGSLDIAWRDPVLFVAILSPVGADQLCRSIAAITNDGDTGKPLGVHGVTLIIGSAKVVDCLV